MEFLSVVAPSGRYGSFPQSTPSGSSVCRCCGQSQVCLRVQSSKMRVTKSCSSERSDQWRLVIGGSGRGSRRGMRLCFGGKEGLKRTFRRESFRRLATDIVLCAYAHAFDVVQRKEVYSSEADSLCDSHDGRSDGGVQFLREESSRFRCQDGDDVGPFSHWDGKRGVPMPSPEESVREGPGGREMVRNARDGSCHPPDELFSHSERFSDSWTMQESLKGGEGISQGRALCGEFEAPERRGHPGDVRSRNYSSNHSSLNIPRSELLKIDELRFSGNMQEGDSSPQVLNLQRALFWLGHLPGLSLTGSFGPETTKALAEFHHSNGFSSPGVWGFHSQQLLWKHIFPETHRSRPEMQIPEKSQLELKNCPDHDLLGTWNFVKKASGKAIGDGLRASATLQRRHSRSFRDFAASVSSTLPGRTVVSQRVGVLLLTVAVIAIILKAVHFCGQDHGQPGRKRVMSWRNGVELRRPLKVSQSFNFRKGHLNSSEGEKSSGYCQSYRRSKSTEKHEKNMCNLLDRLVLFEGQVVRGDYLTHRKMRQSTRSELVLTHENSGVNPSDPASNGNSLPVLSSETVDQSGPNIEAKKISPGLDQFQKFATDPARNVSLHSTAPVQSEKSIRLIGGDRQWSRSSPEPVWASWARIFFSSFSFRKEGLPFGQRKSSSRRALVRSSARVSSPEGALGDAGLHLKSSRIEKGLSEDAQRWREETELDLKKRVEELHKTLQSVEQTRLAAVRALAEEKMHNLELEVNFRRQKEAAAALEEEIRVLKEYRDTFLVSLKKKYSSSAAARAAAALLYQNWDPSDSSARV